MPAISYPYATSTATSTVNLGTISTTTEYIIYSPFSGYIEDSTRNTVTTHFTLNGILVGAYTYEKGNEASTGKITYSHTNYLGTPVISTDPNGDIVEMDITDVYGNYVHRDTRNDNAYHTKAYTSHEFDDVTGLTYAKARYLTTAAHTFLSVDPMLYKLPQSYLIDPQQMNSYAYARNNPIVYTDPTGEVPIPLVILGGIYLYGLYSSYQEAKTTYSNPQATTPQKAFSTVMFATSLNPVRGEVKGGATLAKNVAENAPKIGATVMGGVRTAKDTVVNTSAVLKGAANPIVRDAAAYGREMHKAYKADIANLTTLRKEFTFENGLRADFVDRANKVIYELKPDNQRAIRQGYKQLESYREQMFKQTGEWYDIVLDTYTR